MVDLAAINCTSPWMPRTAILGLCPSTDSKPVEKACTLNVLRPASITYRDAVVPSVELAESVAGCTVGVSLHRPQFQVTLDVGKCV